MAEDQLQDKERAGSASSAPTARQDATRCKRVEDALYRRACGYKVKLKKSFKVKSSDYDRDTGKKVCEREDLREGFEEVHIPADIRVCAYYLNNRDPARWREHPAAEEEIMGGVVDFPPMAELSPSPDGEGEGT